MVAVVALEFGAAVVPVVAVPPEPPPEPDPEFDIVDDVAPVDDVVVVALAGPGFLAPNGAGPAARAGEIATSPTMPAASGNRTRRCMAAS